MKSYLKLALLASLAIPLAACGRASPDAGHAAVLTAKPLLFGHGGVEDEAVTTGSTFVALTTDVDYVDLNPRALVIEYDDIMSSDGIPLSFQATAILQVTDSVELVRHFGGKEKDINGQPAWYVHNVLSVENNLIRDAFKGQPMHALAIEATGAKEVEATVRASLEAYIKEKRIPAVVVNFTLGRVNPPEGIKRQRVETAEQTQRQQTEIQKKLAEDNRKAAEVARAAADNAYRENMGLSPEQFVELQRIDMQKEACASKVSCTFVVGNASALVNSK